jgi:hypothetical protein
MVVKMTMKLGRRENNGNIELFLLLCCPGLIVLLVALYHGASIEG